MVIAWYWRGTKTPTGINVYAGEVTLHRFVSFQKVGGAEFDDIKTNPAGNQESCRTIVAVVVEIRPEMHLFGLEERAVHRNS